MVTSTLLAIPLVMAIAALCKEAVMLAPPMCTVIE
jgi:hypothetical protein